MYVIIIVIDVVVFIIIISLHLIANELRLPGKITLFQRKNRQFLVQIRQDFDQMRPTRCLQFDQMHFARLCCILFHYRVDSSDRSSLRDNALV